MSCAWSSIDPVAWRTPGTPSTRVSTPAEKGGGWPKSVSNAPLPDTTASVPAYEVANRVSNPARIVSVRM